MISQITKVQVSPGRRISYLPKQIGPAYLKFEVAVRDTIKTYTGVEAPGLVIYELTNRGFYLVPEGQDIWHFSNPANGSDVSLSSDALGIVATLYALAEVGMKHPALLVHQNNLYDFMLQHPEAEAIKSATY